MMDGREPQAPALRTSSGDLLSQMKQLQPLPLTKRRWKQSLRIFLSEYATFGPAATGDELQGTSSGSVSSASSRVAWFADVEYPDRSALVFAPQKDGLMMGSSRSGRFVRSISRPRLVTLSACNSGVGPVGEVDVADLGHAFIEAGAEDCCFRSLGVGRPDHNSIHDVLLQESAGHQNQDRGAQKMRRLT